jgi:hypothetical protein
MNVSRTAEAQETPFLPIRGYGNLVLLATIKDGRYIWNEYLSVVEFVRKRKNVGSGRRIQLRYLKNNYNSAMRTMAWDIIEHAPIEVPK